MGIAALDRRPNPVWGMDITDIPMDGSGRRVDQPAGDPLFGTETR